ncbi:hypothetical protein EDC04DRAFT_2900957 [Pisolithus marmoratus]|nr:hypothetical protein EDC04DRAFT_2900957 [Pisolithus marmoratus]
MCSQKKHLHSLTPVLRKDIYTTLLPTLLILFPLMPQCSANFNPPHLPRRPPAALHPYRNRSPFPPPPPGPRLQLVYDDYDETTCWEDWNVLRPDPYDGALFLLAMAMAIATFVLNILNLIDAAKAA